MANNDDLPNLLFLDTFLHDSSEEDLSLDLVQFSKAVIVHEVVVIPCDCKVFAEIPEGFKVGATTPSSFKLDFFVNNLEEPNSSTFEKIGVLDYKENGSIIMKSENKVPTDGLIIKGWYQTITLAVYGTVTSVSQDTTPPPPPPTSQRSKLQAIFPTGSGRRGSQDASDATSKHSLSSVDSKSLTNLRAVKAIPLEHKGAVRDPREKDSLIDSVDTSNAKSVDRNGREESITKQSKTENCEVLKEDLNGKSSSRKRQASGKSADSPEKKQRDMSPYQLFEDVTEPDTADTGDNMDENMDIYGILSDGEIPDGDNDYAPVSTEDNQVTFTNCISQDAGDLAEWENAEDGPWSYFNLGTFNPYQFDLAPLETFSDPSLTDYEVEKQKISDLVSADHEIPSAAVKLLNIIDSSKNNTEHSQKWVEAMETVPSLLSGLAYLDEKAGNKEVVETLIEWAFEGINMNKIIRQKEPSYRLRHMKAGIKMAGFLCTCDANISLKMLERNIQHKLLDLYTSKHMSTPLKLLILSSLDQSLRFKEGIKFFLGKNLKLGKENDRKEVLKDCNDVEYLKSPYQRVAEVFSTKQTSQPLAGLKALFKKCHLYEVLLKLSSYIESLINRMPSFESKRDVIDGNIVEGDAVEAVVRVTEIGGDVDAIFQCLTEVHKALSQAGSQICQPVRAFSKSMKFDVQLPASTLPGIYHLFNTCHLMEGIFVLLTSPATCNCSDVLSVVNNIFTFLMSCQSGLLFLSSKVDTINGVLRVLTQNTEFNSEEERELNSANQLGLTLVYYLQIIQHIDQLNEYHIKGSSYVNAETNESAVLAVLLNLSSIAFTQQGREALVEVFTLEDNIATLLRFIEKTGKEEIRSQHSVCFAYAISILLVIVRHSDKVEWLEKFGHRILLVVETEIKSGKSDERIKELHEWLFPLKPLTSFSYNPATVTELVNLLRQHSEEVNELPKSTITVLRILKYLSVPPETKKGEGIELLKYQWVLTELFSSNCLPLFTNILQKVKNMLMFSWQQGFPQTASERSLILALVQPVLQLMKCLLSILISARASKFKDLSALPSLLGLHTVLCSVSPTGVLPFDLQSIQNVIVDILMSFTQPPLSNTNSEEVVGKSLWSSMVKEVLKHALTAPYTFLSGLILFSEMLPLPLPIPCKENLGKKDVEEVMLCRKKWSAHLQPHLDEFKEIIRNLAGTTCQPLTQLLRMTCWQLADLSASTALFVIRSLFDTLIESMDFSIDPIIKSAEPVVADPGATNGLATLTSSTTATTSVSGATNQDSTVVAKVETVLPDEVSASGRTSRILNLLSFLTNQAVVKGAFLSIIRNEMNCDEKYACLLKRLCKLLNLVSDNISHIQSQESIVAIFQSLCDSEISLTNQENCLKPLEMLAHALPMKEHLRLICSSLLNHIDNRDQKFSSILPSLRTLTLLMDHNYGFYYVKQAMEQVPTAFFNLFMQINATFSKDSSDCIATLSSAAECIQFLVIPSTTFTANSDAGLLLSSGNESLEDSAALRTYRMTCKQLQDILGWSSIENKCVHPLHDLEVLLCEYAKDEETLKGVYECIHSVMEILRSEEDQIEIKDVVELELPDPKSLKDQFDFRVMYNIIEEEDDRLTTAYWLATPMGDESDQELDSEKGDLIDMASQYCPGFDLEAELKKGSTSSETSLLPRLRSKLLTKKHADTINTSKMRGAGNFVAPLRGRGFIRGGSGGLGRGDVFRSRPPNTSRPPSMHVDDFVKLETQNQQPNPDMIPVSITSARRPEDTMRGGHTFDRGGARFFANKWSTAIPTAFTHRDDSAILRGIYRGGLGMMAGRGTMRGTATGSPTKMIPWSFRKTGYGNFGRGESIHDSLERMDRRSGAYPYIQNASAIPWTEHKEREQDQRFVGMPIESFMPWRERSHHQRTSNR